jgi:hypothetical protein
MKRIKSFIVLCLIGVIAFSACSRNQNSAKKTNDELYKLAVRDAVFADEDEIFPLVNISREDSNVIWSENKVLVSFMHKYPASYPEGKEIQLKWGNVWCVSTLELQKWIKDNSENISDWTLRLHQLMGLPEGKTTTITSIWIDPELLYRPACVTDKNSVMKNTLQKTGNEAFDSNYKNWFDSNIIWSYFDSAYPWTRLGYTYDWADNGKEYGLSEFLIFSGAECTIESTDTIEDFVEKLRALGSN